MKKRFLSIIVCLAMVMSVFTAMPAIASAAEGNDIAQMTVEEQYEYIMGLDSDSEIEAELSKLSDDEYKLLEEYAYEKAVENNDLQSIETKVFTEAGPFMPAVDVSGGKSNEESNQKSKASAKSSFSLINTASNSVISFASLLSDDNDEGNEGSDENSENGLILSKNATANDDGTYTITMEAYTTGTVTNITKTVPVDIVLVLDQSGSMAYDFSGKSTNTNKERRQYAMKQAVNNFIGSVSEKYADDADHRIALVTFGSGATTLQGWTNVNENGKSTLQGKISNLPDSPSGATNVAAGMSQAETLMGERYNYTGDNTTRQKVVIVFTDGVPTTSTNFDTTVATNAIASAKTLKGSGCTVYSVGIFNGANPEELYGEKWNYTVYGDISCNGEIGSYWGGSWLSSILGTNDFDGIDIAAGNRFLNYISSNFNGAEEIGVERGSYNPGDHMGGVGFGYMITKNFTRDDSKYYLTANNSNSLNTIFQTISENIQTSNIDLGSETVIKDIVTPYFDMPTDTRKINLYTADYNGTSFGDKVSAGEKVKATKDGSTVSVTGFDFNENFVSDTVKTDGTYGKKLIIEFTVSPKSNFLGGAGVPTNDAQSGVYDKDGNLIENFEVPTVDVPVTNNFTVTAADKNIYLYGNLDEDDLKKDAVITFFQGTDNEVTYGKLENWQKAYVDFEEVVTPNSVNNADSDSEYTFSFTIKSKETSSNVSSVNKAAKGKINVFKPEITFKDSDAYYGGGVPDFEEKNHSTTIWKHGEDSDEEVKMYGEKPDIDIQYTYSENEIDENGIAATMEDIPVDVTAKIESNDLEDYIKHEACDPACGYDSDKCDFLVHIDTCKITIVKEGMESGDDQTFIFNVVGDNKNAYSAAVNLEVVIDGNGRAVITGLPVGNYTVTEQNGWSWRYKLKSTVPSNPLVLDATSPNGTINFLNEKKARYWLDGNAYNENVFDAVNE